MKRKLSSIAIILFFLFVNPIWGQWVFRVEDRKLLYQKDPFIPYSKVLTPIGYFNFEKFASNPFNIYGWFKINQLNFDLKNGQPMNQEQIKKGWFFSEKKPSNLPADWIYFPLKKLWSSPKAFFRLYRLWNRFYESIPTLSRAIYNHVKEKSFYRITSNYLAANVRRVDIKIPDNWILVFDTYLQKGGNRKNFIFYVSDSRVKKRQVHTIIVTYLYTSGVKKHRRYKIIYQNETGLDAGHFR